MNNKPTENSKQKGPNFEDFYYRDLQGDFYGPDYYRDRDLEEESAIVYSDDEDKRIFSYIIRDFFSATKVLEIGCAMGYLLRQLLPFGINAYGIDFSEYCVQNAPDEIRNRIELADLLNLSHPADSYELVIGLDILEHLPASLLPKALHTIHRILQPGGIYLGVIPTYGPNKYGPMVFDYHQRESWVRDAHAGKPFQEIPLDVNGKPHMGHLIHATVQWWEDQFFQSGFTRMGIVEEKIHSLYDNMLDRGRWGIFVFEKNREGFLQKILYKRSVIDTLYSSNSSLSTPEGFFNWEFWPDDGWVRWTDAVATDIVKKKKAYGEIPYLVDHPDCNEENPVIVQFILGTGTINSVTITQKGWRKIRLKWDDSDKIANLRLSVSRTFQPDSFFGNGDKRELGIAMKPITWKMV